MPIVSQTKQRNADQASNYNSKYDISNFIPFIEIEDSNGNIEVVPDYLNWNLTSFLRTLTDWTPVPYNGAVPLTTLVNATYNTTTLIWLVLVYNGFTSALEIPPGTTIKMPRQDQIDSYLNNLNNSVGQVILV